VLVPSLADWQISKLADWQIGKLLSCPQPGRLIGQASKEASEKNVLILFI
jgi:hypothetical protein